MIQVKSSERKRDYEVLPTWARSRSNVLKVTLLKTVTVWSAMKVGAKYFILYCSEVNGMCDWKRSRLRLQTIFPYRI